MDPYPPAQTPPPQQNPYEFIVNPTPPSKRPLLGAHIPGIKDPFIAKIIMILGGVIILMVIVGIIVSVLFSGKTNTQDLVGIAEAQTELVRVATQGTTQSTQQITKNLAINVELGVQTNQQQFLDYLGKHGQKLGTKTLGLKHSSTTDQQLTTAIQSSTFDSVFVQIMQNQLQSYVSELEQAGNNASSTTAKQLIQTSLGAAQKLLAQVPSSVDLQSQTANPNQN
ncbi:MAG TPA: hypothetical protein VHT70_02825 [Candidatus Saccharimonadales bacterium]|nr:hypothetical protein [Candidatus Saccharimonadales bacterium]